MEQLFVVTRDGEVESHWFCDRSVVNAYIDSKPNPNGGRHSIDRDSEWNAKQLMVFTGTQEKYEFDHAALVKSGLAKLTVEEKIALCLTLEEDDQAS